MKIYVKISLISVFTLFLDCGDRVAMGTGAARWKSLVTQAAWDVMVVLPAYGVLCVLVSCSSSTAAF